MKIILFTDSLGAGGAQRQLVGLSVLLKSIGIDVKVAIYYQDYFYKHILDDKNITCDLIDNAVTPLCRILSTSRYFALEKPDWVIAYQETPSLVACIAKLLSNRFKLIVSERNVTQKVGFNEKIRFKLYHLANFIVPNSYTQSAFLITNYQWMKRKIITIPNFVNFDDFSPSYHIKRHAPLIMVAASLLDSKNIEGMIYAVKNLIDKGYKFNVKWYGATNYTRNVEGKYQELISQLGLADYFEIIEKTTDIKEKYDDCDFFCLPSFFEGTPNVICEAISVGRPIICSAICDNAYYVKDGVNGFLFNPKDSKDISDKIEKALNLNSEDYLNYCKNSRMIAEKLLTHTLFLERYLKLIR
jgi:glycosyltransferase involved in cell wall biosynthesis